MGGERSTPRITGVISFPDESTAMLLGLSSSVPNKLSGSELDLNSDTTPLRLISSPTCTSFWMVEEVVKTFKPLDARTSLDFGPAIKNPSGP